MGELSMLAVANADGDLLQNGIALLLGFTAARLAG